MNSKNSQRHNEKAEEVSKVINTDYTDENVEMFNFYNKDIGDNIHPKHDLLLDCKISSAISIIIKHLKVIPNFSMKSNNTEFILRACNLIENLGIRKKGDVTKKDVFINVYKQLFSDISDESLTEILHIIDFLLAHKLIRKIKIYKRVIRFAKLNLLPTFLY
jgi:hypothetical protein